ncbi:MAG: patatin-like phospholipase family protein [Streptosporangiaceae bacterium]|jgi:NTE family protein
MDPERLPARSRPRIGLVLGAGGVLGGAWMAGALPALQECLPCAVNDVDVIVGTSAGSVLAAALRCRISVGELIAHQRGEAAGVLRSAAADEIGGRAFPPPPHLRVGSPRLMLSAVLAPHRVHPLVGASAWLPRGRAQHTALRDMVHVLHGQAHSGAHGPAAAPLTMAGPGPDGPDWVDGQTWIVAVDYDSGRRVIFGRPGAPRARLPEAVVASCSIPGWFEPAVIGGRRYVDGGVRSPTSLGVLARSGLDEVYVLAPMASTSPGRAARPHEQVERKLRRLIALALLREAQLLRSAGIRVTLVTPGPEDLAAMGLNLMDPRRRLAVMETSLRTSAAALASIGPARSQVA